MGALQMVRPTSSLQWVRSGQVVAQFLRRKAPLFSPSKPPAVAGTFSPLQSSA